MSATKAPAKRRNDKPKKPRETTDTSVLTKPNPKPTPKTETKVYPQVPIKRVAVLGVSAITAFYLSRMSIGVVDLYFLRIVAFGLLTYIAFSYAMNITKYRDAPHNQPKPGPIKKSAAYLGRYIKKRDKPLSMKWWARFGRWNRRILVAVGRWLRRAGRLTYCWILVVCGVLSTLYATYASVFLILRGLGVI